MNGKLSHSFNTELDYIDIGTAEIESTSLFTTERNKIKPLNSSPRKSYKEIWQRAKSKIVTSLRMKRIINDIKQLGPGSISDLKISDNQLLNYLSSKTLKVLDAKDFGIHNEIPRSIFDPNGFGLSLWNLTMVIILIYTGTITPFIIGFVDEELWDPFYTIDVIFDFFFMFDFLLTFNTAYYNNENQIVVSRKKIFLHYLSGWMAIDALSAVPFTLIDTYVLGNSQRSAGRIAKISRLRNLPKLVRLSRVMKIMKSMGNLQDLDLIIGLNQRINRFIKVLFGTGISLHIVSCLWHLSAKIDMYGPKTWVYRYGFLDSNIWERYENAVYWALTTLATIGYGDIVPVTTLEKILSMFWMVFAVYFLSFGISSLTSMISQIESKEKIIEDRLLCVDEFFKVIKLSKRVKHKLRRTVRNSSEIVTFSRDDRKNLFDILPMKMKLELALDMHEGVISKFSFFNCADEAFLASIAVYLEPLYFNAKSVVWSEGETANGIYFIVAGRVNYSYGAKNLVFSSISEGQYFGDIEVFEEQKRKFNVITVTHVQFMILPVNVVWEINTEFPLIWKELVDVTAEREKKILNNLAEMIVIKEINESGRIKSIDGKEVKVMVENMFKKIVEGARPKAVQKKNKLKSIERQLETNTQAIIRIEKILEKIIASNVMN